MRLRGRKIERGVATYIVAIIVAVIAAYGAGKAYETGKAARSDVAQIRTLAAELKRSVQSPTHGKDIAVWCNAINADRTYNRAFVRKVTDGKVAYALGPLDCASLQAGEAASTTTKH